MVSPPGHVSTMCHVVRTLGHRLGCAAWAAILGETTAGTTGPPPTRGGPTAAPPHRGGAPATETENSKITSLLTGAAAERRFRPRQLRRPRRCSGDF